MIKMFLVKMHVLYAGDDFKGRNSILAQMLGVLAFLIDYGAANGVSEIVCILIGILDGNTDEGLPGKKLNYKCYGNSDGVLGHRRAIS